MDPRLAGQPPGRGPRQRGRRRRYASTFPGAGPTHTPRRSRSSRWDPAEPASPTCTVASITRESGDLAFQPVDGAGRLLPLLPPIPRFDHLELSADLLSRPRCHRRCRLASLHRVEVGHAASRQRGGDGIDRRLQQLLARCRSSRPQKETQALVKSRGAAPFVLFPEDATRPIRMRHDLPASWVAPDRAPERHRQGHARRVVRLPGRRVRQQAGARQRARQLHCAPRSRHHRRVGIHLRQPRWHRLARPALHSQRQPSRRARSIPSGAACRCRSTQSPAATPVPSPLPQWFLTPLPFLRTLVPPHVHRSLPLALTILPDTIAASRRQRSLAPLPAPLAQLDALPG